MHRLPLKDSAQPSGDGGSRFAQGLQEPPVIQTVGNMTVVQRERVQRLHQALLGTKISAAKALAEDFTQRDDAVQLDRTSRSNPRPVLVPGRSPAAHWAMQSNQGNPGLSQSSMAICNFQRPSTIPYPILIWQLLTTTELR